MPVERVLVVDDEPDMAESLRRILAKAGYEVLVETDGDRVLERVTAEAPDLIVTDLRMPGLSGIELMDQLRSRRVEVPVIVETGLALSDDVLEAIDRGAADYVAKPFAPEELVLRVRKALAMRRLRAENARLRERVDSKPARA